MIYVMSDIHGCYEKYKTMLEKIKFSEADTLYILGDVVDRGTKGMQILLDIAKHNNIVLFRGNHEELAEIFLNKICLLKNDLKEVADWFESWFSDGGKATLEEFLKLSKSEKQIVLDVLKQSVINMEIEVNKKMFLLAHTVPEVDRICDYEEWTKNDFIWGEPDYEEIYFDDKYIVTGHTPTGYIDRNMKGRIWKGNNHIAVDCGAPYGGPLGCICLDTFEETYVV